MHGQATHLTFLKNLWALVNERLSELPSAKNLEILENQPKTVWAEIDPVVLKNLIDGMPNRVKTCVELNDGYISK